MRILIVDDDFQTRAQIQRFLHPYGYIDIATDGEEAVEAFCLALKEDRPYNLIALDLLMPNSDGQEALREIREIEKEQGVPEAEAVKVIIISGLNDSKEVHDAFFLGNATSYLVKPLHRNMLLNEIESLGITLDKRRALEEQ